jgi:hypothetical protein
VKLDGVISPVSISLWHRLQSVRHRLDHQVIHRYLQAQKVGGAAQGVGGGGEIGGGGRAGGWTIRDRARTWRTQYAKNKTALGGEPWEGGGGGVEEEWAGGRMLEGRGGPG